MLCVFLYKMILHSVTRKYRSESIYIKFTWKSVFFISCLYTSNLYGIYTEFVGKFIAIYTGNIFMSSRLLSLKYIIQRDRTNVLFKGFLNECCSCVFVYIMWFIFPRPHGYYILIKQVIELMFTCANFITIKHYCL